MHASSFVKRHLVRSLPILLVVWFVSFGSIGGRVHAATLHPLQPHVSDQRDRIVVGPSSPSLEIVTTPNEKVVSGTTQTKIVGQRIQLRVRSKSSGKLSNIQWEPSGNDVIQDYTQSLTTGMPTKLSAAELQKADIHFYWFQGGKHTVTVSATDGGVPLQATATYNVLAPSGIDMKSETGDVAVSNPGFRNSRLELHFGSNAKPGISWTFRATAPSGGYGEIAATQLDYPLRTRICYKTGKIQTLSPGGAYLLDTRVLYPLPDGRDYVDINGGSSATWQSDDSPGQRLTSDYRKASVVGNYMTYFMYKSKEEGSIWVTIGLLSWHWTAQTTIANPATNKWSRPTRVSHTPDGTRGIVWKQLPHWNGNFKGLKFKPSTC